MTILYALVHPGEGYKQPNIRISPIANLITVLHNKGGNMKYQYTCCIVCMLLSVCVFAQAPDTLWTRTYGGALNDGANSILQTSDGGYIVAGYTDSFGAFYNNVWILKLDSLGDTLWAKTYGEDVPEEAASIQHTTDSGYIVVGNKGFHAAVWLLKMDENGDTLWTKTISPDQGRLRGSDVKQTSDGGYVIAGSRGSHYLSWIAVIRTDSLGDTLWINWDEGGQGNSVLEASDGNYIIAGKAFGYGAGSEFVLIKVDREGTMLWCKGYTDLSSSGAGYDVLETNDSCLTACGGWFYWQVYIYLIRTDANGDTLWTKRLGDGIAHSLDKTFDGGYIIAGETSGDVVFIKTDSLGDTLWTAVYGGPGHDSPSKVLQTSDGGYIMVGETDSFGAGNADVWIVKLGPDVGVEEHKSIVFDNDNRTTTIFCGPLQLPEGKTCKVYDITGRVVESDKIQPGIYFIEVDGVVTQKVVKVR
jgi:hypothetical protein